MSTNEDNYITQKELEKAHQERRERQLEALRKEERAGIAVKLSSSEEVAQEALDLGFDAATARVLPMIPLIEVAWADGKISSGEVEKIMELAASRGIEDAAAIEFIELLLEKKPSSLFFERTSRVLAHLIDEDPDNPETRDVLEQAKAVAAAAGGFFGLTDPISGDEKAMLDELAEILS